MQHRSYYIVMYDITDPKALQKVAVILTKEGWERMNNSVWVGSFHPARREFMKERILELLRLPEAQDSKLFVLPVKLNDLKKMRSLNGRKPENLDYWIGELKTMFC
jgi:CRISPR-associated endonuclease Cas2